MSLLTLLLQFLVFTNLKVLKSVSNYSFNLHLFYYEWYLSFFQCLKASVFPSLGIICSIWPFQFEKVFFFFVFTFLWPHLWHTKVPRLGVESELQLPAYAAATATPDLSCVCDLHHSSQQRQILNPLRDARDQTCVLMNTNQILFCWAMMGNPVPFSIMRVYNNFFGCSLLVRYLYFLYCYRQHCNVAIRRDVSHLMFILTNFS